MEITLKTPFTIDWEDEVSHEILKKTITKLEVSYIHIDYRRNAVVMSPLYKDDDGFRASANHAAFKTKAINPYIAGNDFVTLDATGLSQRELYSHLQSKNLVLDGTVS
jgi:hypothetical protein